MKKSHEGVALPVIIIIVALLAISGVAYVYKNKTPVITDTPTATSTIPDGREESVDQDWKTFRNEKYGFELSIPKTWTSVLNEDILQEGDDGATFARFFIGENPYFRGIIGQNSEGGAERGVSIIVHKRIGKWYERQPEGFSRRFTEDERSGKRIHEECLPVNYRKEVTIGKNKTTAVRVYVKSDECFNPNQYEYIVKTEKYDYEIIPLPINGIAYDGYDGMSEVQKSLPEFPTILSSFSLTTD